MRAEVFLSQSTVERRLVEAFRHACNTSDVLAASMAVLDTAAKYREDLLYTRYEAGRQTIERFRKDPPYAYVIPNQQRDVPTAATLD